jgi:SAM-dependent methyltransferase
MLKYYLWRYEKIDERALSYLGTRYYGKDLHPKNIYAYHHDFFVENVTAEDIVIDLGCGTGLILSKVGQKCKKGIGIDYNDKNLEYARSHCKGDNIEFYKGDITNIDAINKMVGDYTVVIVSQILEHLEDPVHLLKNLKCDRLLISVPSEENWIVQMKKDLGMPYFGDSDHKRLYTKEMLKEHLEEAGFGYIYMGHTSLGSIECVARRGKEKLK